MSQAWVNVQRAFLLLLSLSVAQSAFADGQATALDGLQFLSRARFAAQRLDYAGTFIYQQGPQVWTSRIVHLRVGDISKEKLEVLDGPPRETIRNVEEIISYLPAERRLIVESRISEKAFPALPGVSPEQIAQYYRARKIAGDRVAGRDTEAIALVPIDAMRYGYRLWLEKSSGLLMRAQTLNEKGQVIEQIAFTTLAIGNITRAQIRPAYPDTRGWRIDNAVAKPLDLSHWTAKWMPGGFRQIHSVKRHMGGLIAGRPGSQKEVEQLVYSDGLAGISIFIELWSAQQSGLPIQQGAINMVGKRHKEFWLTIVGEVPMAAIMQVADSIELTAIK